MRNKCTGCCVLHVSKHASMRKAVLVNISSHAVLHIATLLSPGPHSTHLYGWRNQTRSLNHTSDHVAPTRALIMTRRFSKIKMIAIINELLRAVTDIPIIPSVGQVCFYEFFGR